MEIAQVDDEAVAAFARDGVVCVRQALSAQEVTQAAAAIDGSHRGPWLMPRTFLTKEARWFPEGSPAELPDIDANRSLTLSDTEYRLGGCPRTVFGRLVARRGPVRQAGLTAV